MKGTILTNDPSMTAWGYSVIDWSGNVVEAGCITTEPDTKKKRIRKGDDNIRRTTELVAQLHKIIKSNSVNYILSELPHGAQNYNAATMIGRVEGIMSSLSITQQIGIEWYNEHDAKKHLFGRKQVTKYDTIQEVKRLMGDKMKLWTKTKYKDEAIADSLAIYLTALEQSSTLKLMKSINHKRKEL